MNVNQWDVIILSVETAAIFFYMTQGWYGLAAFQLFFELVAIGGIVLREKVKLS